MPIGTAFESEQETLSLVSGEHGAGTLTGTAKGRSGFVMLGVYQATPTAVSDGQRAILQVNRLGYAVAERQNVLLHSATTAAASTATGTWMTALGVFKEADILVHISALTGDTCTANFYLDSRLDGTNAINLARSAAVIASGYHAFHMTKNNPAGQVAAIGTDAGAGTSRAIGWADDLRVRTIISGDTAVVTYRVWINLIG